MTTFDYSNRHVEQIKTIDQSKCNYQSLVFTFSPRWTADRRIVEVWPDRPRLPPLLHEISGSPVLFCKNTAHKQQQERSQTRIENDHPTFPLSSTESQAHRFCSAKIPLTNSNRNAHKLQQERSQTRKVTRPSTPPPYPPRNLRLTGFFLQEHSQTAPRTLTNKNTVVTIYAPESQIIRFFSKKPLTSSNKKARKTRRSKSETEIR